MKTGTSQETIIAVLNNYKEGKTYTQICEKHGVSRSAVGYWVEKAGVQRRREHEVDWDEIKKAVEN